MIQSQMMNNLLTEILHVGSQQMKKFKAHQQNENSLRSLEQCYGLQSLILKHGSSEKQDHYAPVLSHFDTATAKTQIKLW
ncbi:Hypothetical protein Bdt_1506 [Bdellovibrio bacteriovorus str. Tiberius]|uniref:Uncharacterized protein n=1 Tax=Bdellovibrio bacteriovorus str. Tiberius TaxID=1069642 RepID=K7ZF63_BDEBC|nr:Hypothetical protein Bdt_1506 [Bdellovibrio bacteriovorus str. Tiberius]